MINQFLFWEQANPPLQVQFEQPESSCVIASATLCGRLSLEGRAHTHPELPGRSLAASRSVPARDWERKVHGHPRARTACGGQQHKRGGHPAKGPACTV